MLRNICPEYILWVPPLCYLLINVPQVVLLQGDGARPGTNLRSARPPRLRGLDAQPAGPHYRNDRGRRAGDPASQDRFQPQAALHHVYGRALQVTQYLIGNSDL